MDAEKESILLENGNIYVSACPGRGKTTLLIERLKRNVNKNDNCRLHLVLTHTNAAAEEIIDRLNKLNVTSENIWCGTIHSFFLEWIIRHYAGSLDRLTHGFTLIVEYEQRKIVRELCVKHEVNGKINLVSDEKGKISLEPETLDNELNLKYKRVILDYFDYKTHKRLIDFNDILLLSKEILSKNDKIGFILSKLIGFIYLDESQDTSYLQFDCLSEITKYNNLETFIVGDTDQAIYLDMGISIKYSDTVKKLLSIDNFKNRTLVGCYRSTEAIVNYYKKYSCSNMDIKSRRSEIGFSPSVNYIIKSELSDRVINLLRKYKDKYGSVSGVAVLGPNQVYLRNVLLDIYDKSTDFIFDYDKMNPLYQLYNTIWKDIVTFSMLNITVANYSKRHLIAMRIIESAFEVNSVNIYAFKIKMNEFNCQIPVFTVWFKKLHDYFINNFPESPILDIDFKVAMAKLGRGKNNLSSLAMKKIINSDDDVVRVSSFHGVKGEEFNYVIALGFHKGAVPHHTCAIKGAEYESEVANRLIYVALSRAKNFMNIYIDDSSEVSDYFIK